MNYTSSNLNSVLSIQRREEGENGARERGAPLPIVMPLGNSEQQKQTADGLPDKYCPAHMPLGTVDNCGACGAAGRLHKTAIADRTRDAQRVKEALANTLADCRLCDEHGWRLGDDNTVDDRNLRCDHGVAQAVSA